MEFLGTIEPGVDSAVGKPEWIRLIEEHPQLALSPAREGINPFTRGPMLFKPKPDAARVMAGPETIGSIYWALDDSRRLVVSAEAGSEEQVRTVAEDIAGRLGWRFVARDAA
jgi:hypothetical protein